MSEGDEGWLKWPHKYVGVCAFCDCSVWLDSLCTLMDLDAVCLLIQGREEYKRYLDE
jgi:hypothetical protein